MDFGPCKFILKKSQDNSLFRYTFVNSQDLSDDIFYNLYKQYSSQLGQSTDELPIDDFKKSCQKLLSFTNFFNKTDFTFISNLNGADFGGGDQNGTDQKVLNFLRNFCAGSSRYRYELNDAPLTDIEDSVYSKLMFLENPLTSISNFRYFFGIDSATTISDWFEELKTTPGVTIKHLKISNPERFTQRHIDLRIHFGAGLFEHPLEI